MGYHYQLITILLLDGTPQQTYLVEVASIGFGENHRTTRVGQNPIYSTLYQHTFNHYWLKATFTVPSKLQGFPDFLNERDPRNHQKWISPQLLFFDTLDLISDLLDSGWNTLLHGILRFKLSDWVVVSTKTFFYPPKVGIWVGQPTNPTDQNTADGIQDFFGGTMGTVSKGPESSSIWFSIRRQPRNPYNQMHWPPVPGSG